MERKESQERGPCRCPYCEAEIEAATEMPAFCQPCQIVIVSCRACGSPVREDSERCPACGEKP